MPRKGRNHLIFLCFFRNARILWIEGPNDPATSKGDAAVFADRMLARENASSNSAFALNDNELEGDLPAISELLYLRRGLTQAGGKLPLFDLDGQAVDKAVVRTCLARGWAEPWFSNPLKPDWLVCKLTAAGRRVASAD